MLVRMMTIDQKCGQHQQKLTETVDVGSISEPEKTLLLDLLRDYLDIFAIEENDRGETDFRSGYWRCIIY